MDAMGGRRKNGIYNWALVMMLLCVGCFFRIHEFKIGTLSPQASHTTFILCSV